MTLEERFWAKVSKTDTCWLWTAYKTDYGYGVFKVGRRTQKAYRVAYELEHGPIPDGITLDHQCHNKSCVRPAHLKPVTHKQNMENRAGANKGSKSGIRGVHWNANTGKWKVAVVHHGDSYYGGLHISLEDAAQVALELRKRLFSNSDEVHTP